MDWETYAGIPGGLPDGSWTKSGSTILASTYGNGSSDASGAVQTALNACSGNKYVLLSAGTFLFNSGVTVPSNCVLRGAGADQTIVTMGGAGFSAVTLGSHGSPNFSSALSVSNATAGSMTLTLSSTSGLSIGQFLLIDQLNDDVTVTAQGTQGSCNWCDGNQTSNGSRTQGQIDKITGITGTTVTLEMPLMVSYTRTPLAVPFSMVSSAGLENLQIFQNNSAGSPPSQVYIGECAYCWVSGIENNYAAGDHIDVDWSYRGIIQNSYFSNDFLHVPGCCDSDVDLRYKATGFVIQNNIFERLHTSLMLEWGAAGNVIGYNFSTGDFDSTSTTYTIQDIAFHGAHPQFNLFEGNVSNTMGQDGIHGSAANNTAFRNWVMGTGSICQPLTGRGTVLCATANGSQSSQAAKAFDVNTPMTNYFLIGNVEGSAQQQTLGTGVALAVAICDASLPKGTPCGANSRIYQGWFYNETFGYGTTGDTGGGSDSILPWKTAFIHGEYSTVANTISWTNGVTHTLPPSFYLSSRPSWWGSTIPWPAIGPDVTGGTGPGGHVYSTTAANPAVNCYYHLMGGIYGGAGSPYTFNADRCYLGVPSGAQPPSPPTGLTVIVK